MFLTTVRVRRARGTTLDHALATAQLQETKDRRGDLVEVMSHGQPVAILDAANLQGPPMWVHPDVREHVSDTRLVQLVRLSISLMDATKKGGLAESGEREKSAVRS